MLRIKVLSFKAAILVLALFILIIVLLLFLADALLGRVPQSEQTIDLNVCIQKNATRDFLFSTK